MRLNRFSAVLTSIFLAWHFAAQLTEAQVDNPELFGPGEKISPDDAINSKPIASNLDAEPLGRGPIHEAFAEQAGVAPAAAPTVNKRPPEPIKEIPPEIKPEGENVAWIPGYWAWDDEPNEFIWVSGVWRKLPPGRRWVPGYWTETGGGFRWASGTWAAADAAELELLPPPPKSLEQGPNRIAESADDMWIPGCWIYRNNAYGWRPGYWSQGYANWIWNPDRYMWTPRGCLFVGGYWDYPVTRRGYLFAPYRFRRPVYRDRLYTLSPQVALHVGNVFSHLFVRPSCHHYYYGDFYGHAQLNRGYLPWHHYHKRYHCPLLSHYSRHYHHRGVNYVNHLHRRHEYYVQHSQHRPHKTLGHVYDRHQQHAAHKAANTRLPIQDIVKQAQKKQRHTAEHARHSPHDNRHELGSHIEDFVQRANPALAAVRVPEKQRQAAAAAGRNEIRALIDQRIKASNQAAGRQAKAARQKITLPHNGGSLLTNREKISPARTTAKVAEVQHRIREAQQSAVENRARAGQKINAPTPAVKPAVKTLPNSAVRANRKLPNTTRTELSGQIQSKILDAQRRGAQSRAKSATSRQPGTVVAPPGTAAPAARTTARTAVPTSPKTILRGNNAIAPSLDRAKQNRSNTAAPQQRAAERRAAQQQTAQKRIAQQQAAQQRAAQARARTAPRNKPSTPAAAPKTQRQAVPRSKPQRPTGPAASASRPPTSRRSATQNQRDRARERN